jgi:hypothetical protein
MLPLPLLLPMLKSKVKPGDGQQMARDLHAALDAEDRAFVTSLLTELVDEWDTLESGRSLAYARIGSAE